MDMLFLPEFAEFMRTTNARNVFSPLVEKAILPLFDMQMGQVGLARGY